MAGLFSVFPIELTFQNLSQSGLWDQTKIKRYLWLLGGFGYVSSFPFWKVRACDKLNNIGQIDFI